MLGPDLEPRQEKTVDFPNRKLQQRSEEKNIETLNGGVRETESECFFFFFFVKVMNRWKGRKIGRAHV